MEELVLLKSDKDILSFTWNENDYSNHYVVYIIDDNFNYIPYKDLDINYLDINKEELKDYIGLKIEYVYIDKKQKKRLVISSSKPFLFNNTLELDIINLKSIKSYKGISIGFITKTIYDEFRVFKYNNGNKELFKITEDFLISSDKLSEGDSIIVEAYKKEENRYVLKASSDVYKISIEKVKCTSSVPKVSVIIPVYNSELFISRCIDSILLSTLSDLEIITVNDGSKDNSLDILNWYKDNYPSIVKVDDKENEGVSFTRNRGIDLATGEYIAFVDNDDMVHPYMYEELFMAAIESFADVAIAKTVIREDIHNYTVYMDYKRDSKKDYFVYDYYTMIDISENMKPRSIYFVAIWNKIIKASVAKGKYFDKQNYYEDQAYTRMIYSYCNTFAFCYDAYYIWDKRIQKTKGTQTNRYKAENEDELLEYDLYVLRANVYGVYNGNQERIEQLADLFIRDSYGALIDRYHALEDNRLYPYYRDEILKISKMTDLTKNRYLRLMPEAYDFAMRIIEKG